MMNSSKEIAKYQTAQINPWKEGTRTYKGEVSYGMRYLYNNSQPYFSITGSTWVKKGRKGFNDSQCKEIVWAEDSCGCIHDLIAKKKKSLAPLIEFHLADQNGLQTYYLENGYYHYQHDLDTFKSYIRLSEDELIPEVPKIELPVILNDNGTEIDLPEKEQEKIIEKARKKFITDWMRTREPKLKKEFEEVMKQFNVEFISQEEIDTLKAKNKAA